MATRSAIAMIPGASWLGKLTDLMRWGLGGTEGPGTQFMSWIHETDFIRAVEFLIAREDLQGVVNVCSPNPLPNREFLRLLRRAFGVRIGPPLPEWALRVGSMLLRTEAELVLKSRRVVPGRLLAAGFEFEYPDWPAAVRDLAGRGGARRRRISASTTPHRSPTGSPRLARSAQATEKIPPYDVVMVLSTGNGDTDSERVKSGNMQAAPILLSELAARLGCRLIGDGAISITGVAGMEQADSSQLTFLANPKYAHKVKDTRAGAILVAEPIPALPIPQLISTNPYLDFARALALFYQPPRPNLGRPPLGIGGRFRPHRRERLHRRLRGGRRTRRDRTKRGSASPRGDL